MYSLNTTVINAANYTKWPPVSACHHQVSRTLRTERKNFTSDKGINHHSFTKIDNNRQEAFGSETSGHVDCLYWLLTVQNAEQNID
jgi:hypothetical protein